MVKGWHEHEPIEVKCPCCGARLKVDASLGKVIFHEPPHQHGEARDITRAGQLLEQERSRREALFQKSAEDEKIKPQLLEKKFDEALKKSRDEPVAPPDRDIDLD